MRKVCARSSMSARKGPSSCVELSTSGIPGESRYPLSEGRSLSAGVVLPQSNRSAMAHISSSEEIRDLASAIAIAMRRRKCTVAVAESLTSGNVGRELGAAEGASQWFLGGVIAYAKSVKFSLLGVDPGPVVTALCAHQMADGVARLTGADFTVALTGVGGPEEEEAQSPGLAQLNPKQRD